MSDTPNPNVSISKSAIGTAIWWGVLAYAGYGALTLLFHERGVQKRLQSSLAAKKARKAMGPLGRAVAQLEARKQVVKEHREQAAEDLRFVKREERHVRALQRRVASLKKKV